MSVRRTKLLGALGGALLVAFVSCGKTGEDKGGLMLTIAADGPLAIDQLDVQVRFAGAVLNRMSFRVPEEAELPTTLAIVSNGDPTASVEITVVGWIDQEPVDRRDAIVTQVPTERVARMPIVLSGRCAERVALNDDGEAISTCPHQQTCSPDTGDCVDVYIESASLASYQPGDEDDTPMSGSGGVGGGGGGESGAPSAGGAGPSGGSSMGGSGGKGGSGGMSGSSGTAGSGGASGSGAEGGSAGSGGSTAKAQCDDAEDNDGDGAIDGFDPECKSRIDNDEGSFATGLPGDNVDPQWYDCFFDTNTGSGDDGCRYAAECMTDGLPQDDPDCEQTQGCRDFCTIRAPNGCDCFGCCAVWNLGGLVSVWITPSCSMTALGDDVACPPCVQSPNCENPLDLCELALGMTVAEQPSECAGVQDCVDAMRCGPGVADCNADEYCVNGCCVRDGAL